MRALKTLQRSANKSRTQALNQLRAVVLTAPDELRERLRTLPDKQLLATCAGFRVRADDDTVAAITRLTLRELAHRIAFLDDQLKTATTRLQRLASSFAPDLISKTGIGPDTSSTLLLAAGDDPHRLRDERSYAALLRSSPVPANSGQRQNRHRLDRGGDRQANAALWRIAIVRLATDQRTRDYVDKRVSEGKAEAEAIRCLERYIAREVFNALPRRALLRQ